jgi:hypothetical protein
MRREYVVRWYRYQNPDNRRDSSDAAALVEGKHHVSTRAVLAVCIVICIDPRLVLVRHAIRAGDGRRRALRGRMRHGSATRAPPVRRPEYSLLA